MPWFRKSILVAATAALVPLAGCGGNGADSPERTLTVSAAASLTESFTEIGEAFEAENPDTTITFTFDSSGTLSQQILDGAPVDVFASADQGNLDKVSEADLIDGSGEVFARNQLVIITQPGNPEGIETLEDLVDVGVVSLCAEEAPCGKFVAQALEVAGVTIDEGNVTRGQNAKATLTAVSEGDAVAGVVYVTDALAAGAAVDAVQIPEDQNVIAAYPIAMISKGNDADLAQSFIDFVLSSEGQAVLAEYGFGPPS